VKLITYTFVQLAETETRFQKFITYVNSVRTLPKYAILGLPLPKTLSKQNLVGGK
jgi:hypothetical protein